MSGDPDGPEDVAGKLKGHGSIDDFPQYECPICDYTTVTDDRVGHHIFHEHYDEIADKFGKD